MWCAVLQIVYLLSDCSVENPFICSVKVHCGGFSHVSHPTYLFPASINVIIMLCIKGDNMGYGPFSRPD
jgi:hypothetical protein